tara:strand:- start:44 stop:481 length:438 start_codon:yes stop_codon:yes gene_type:complete
VTIANFTPWSALIGGILIGSSAGMLMLTLGRIAGISGILGGVLSGISAERHWRIAFVLGLILAAGLWSHLSHGWEPISITGDVSLIIIGGLLVGFGTGVGSGCTSGHGVCGLARLSLRSLAATGTFLAAAVLSVYLIRHVLEISP